MSNPDGPGFGDVLGAERRDRHWELVIGWMAKHSNENLDAPAKKGDVMIAVMAALALRDELREMRGDRK